MRWWWSHSCSWRAPSTGAHKKKQKCMHARMTITCLDAPSSSSPSCCSGVRACLYTHARTKSHTHTHTYTHALGLDCNAASCMHTFSTCIRICIDPFARCMHRCAHGPCSSSSFLLCFSPRICAFIHSLDACIRGPPPSPPHTH